VRGGPTADERALELAYKALSGRDRTVAELRAYLGHKRIDSDAIEHAVEELAGAGFLDDARFAERFAEDKRTIERWGSERVERELRRRGVAPEHVSAAVAAQEPGDELQAALALLVERVPPPRSDRERDRAWRLLARKGYSPELAYEAVRAHAREEAA